MLICILFAEFYGIFLRLFLLVFDFCFLGTSQGTGWKSISEMTYFVSSGM